MFLADYWLIECPGFGWQGRGTDRGGAANHRREKPAAGPLDEIKPGKFKPLQQNQGRGLLLFALILPVKDGDNLGGGGEF